jgi:hypothetical protein
MFADEQIAVHAAAIRKPRRQARPLLASVAPNIRRNLASARMRRAQGAVVSPAEFMAVVAGWGAGLGLLLFIAAVARHLS